LDLQASATDPSPIDASAGFTFAWDVTGDSRSWASATGPDWTFAPDDQGVYTIRLTALDKDGGVGDWTRTVAVGGVAPAAVIDAPAAALRGARVEVWLAAFAPSPADTAAGFTYRIDWGDGTRTTAGPSASTLAVNHAYAAAGVFTARVQAVDKDGLVG